MNLALVSSKGGHLGQIKLIFTEEVLDNNKVILVTEDEKKIGLARNSFIRKYDTYFFRKDFLGVNPFRYFLTTVQLYSLFKRRKINMIITSGAQISIPATIAAKFLGAKVIFIDTVIRVKTPNWSARACYPLSDIFLVQHASMASKYGKKARYVGGII